uniref:TTF-type domain-containing protein n=1 Tax=Clastoptera arizonana TaxID=38151 RepID=A0A1B6DAI5_9HEMI
MKRHQPSGAQNRKLKKSRERSTQLMSGSILKFVHQPLSSKESSENIKETSLTDPSLVEISQPVPGQVEVDPISQPVFVQPEVDAIPRTLFAQVEVDPISQPVSAQEEVNDPKASRDTLPLHENGDFCAGPDKGVLQEEGSEEESEEIGQWPLLVDVGNWQLPLSDAQRIAFVKRGSEFFQHKDGPFDTSFRSGGNIKGETRNLSSAWFYKHLPSGDKVLRKWMVYSPSKKSLFCFCCCLFYNSESIGNDTSKFISGFQCWWKLNPKVSDHEDSPIHSKNFQNWKSLSARLKLNRTIDSDLQAEIGKEKSKWKHILTRLLDITLYLAKQNLPFRGHRENAVSENRGNFLELVQLLSQYDPVLREHIIHIEQHKALGKATVTYLSPQIQNEFILLLGMTVKDVIIKEIREAKYYGILFDSTPDISRKDQMSEVIRYVHIQDGKVQIKESFLGFFVLQGKKADEVTEEILTALESDGLDIALCRSQGYDNAATMAGIHSGVQARIQNINPKALFVPCNNHSLNLCGVHAFSCTPSSLTFFGTLENIYNLFSASTHRWEILTEVVGEAVKRLSDTRWSAHHAALKPVLKNFEKLVDAVEKLCDETENLDTRGAAQIVMANIVDFSFLAYLHLWSAILEEINITQKYLQVEGLSLDKAVIKLKALKLFVLNNRDNLIDAAFEFATGKCEEMNIEIEKRGRRRLKKKTMPGEKADDEGLSFQQELRRSMLMCIDRLFAEMTSRTASLEEMCEKFGLLHPMALVSADEDTLEKLVSNLSENYSEFPKTEILKEVHRIRRYLEAADISSKSTASWSTLRLLQFIVEMDFEESIPHLCLALKLFLTICVSVSTCERSFSKLKLIKNYLRSTMSQVRLNGLAMLSVERELASKINFDDVINQFAEMKSRKKKFH